MSWVNCRLTRFGAINELKPATLSWVRRLDENRLHFVIRYLTPIELEAEYYRETDTRHRALLGEVARN